MKYEINNLGELKRFAQILASLLKKEDVISLIGDLGAGKTTLTQMICRELGVKDYITSPTYSIVNVYDSDDYQIYHLDLYRLENPSELESMDFESYFWPAGITFIEWADKGMGYLPDEMIRINIEQLDEKRYIEILREFDREKQIGEKIDESFSR